MEKLIKKLASIQHDKLLHSFYGTLIYALASLLSIDLAIILVIVLAIVKEIYDEYKYGGFDWVDISVTILIPFILYIGDI